ncbi:hypothetical protein ABH922_003500 [Rhodococcus sp. 27YEA15]
MSLTVDDPHPPYSFVSIQGWAEIDRRPDYVLWVSTECGRRYMGAERAAEFGERNADPNEVIVRVTPRRVLLNTDVRAY